MISFNCRALRQRTKEIWSGNSSKSTGFKRKWSRSHDDDNNSDDDHDDNNNNNNNNSDDDDVDVNDE